jgi:hypothetical protein
VAITDHYRYRVYGQVPKVSLSTVRQRRRIHFQQDGAPPHYIGEVDEYLNTRFPIQWTGRAASIAWPRRSSDITPLDFFLWRFVNDNYPM